VAVERKPIQIFGKIETLTQNIREKNEYLLKTKRWKWMFVASAFAILSLIIFSLSIYFFRWWSLVLVIPSIFVIKELYKKYKTLNYWRYPFISCRYCGKASTAFYRWMCPTCFNVQMEDKRISDPCEHCGHYIKYFYCEECHEKQELT
jgi:hypothetical protein